MPQGRVRSHKVLLTIRHAAVVLAPRHFLAVGLEVRAGDMVVDADFSAADAGEEALGSVRASLFGRIALLVIDTLGQEPGVQPIP